jgi:drug/metabolite transporter (DMT)-like permease
MAAAVTRYAVAAVDPVLISTFRFGLGCLLLLPFALATRARWPRGADLIVTAALGVMFYGGYFVVYARALTLTTAARGSLGIATLPVLTMLVAAALGKERLTGRKTLGVLTALCGVAISLASDLSRAPVGAWKGDAIMIAAMLSMSLYTIYSRPLMTRSSALGYACAGMAAGAALNATVVSSSSGWAALHTLGASHWSALLFLGAGPGALGFFLWVYAVQRTTPTRAAATITVSPLSAAALASLLVSEPFSIGLMVGAVAVAAGIWISSTEKPHDQLRGRAHRPGDTAG